MLGQRRRRWPNNKPTLGQRLVFAGLYTAFLNSARLCVHVVTKDGSSAVIYVQNVRHDTFSSSGGAKAISMAASLTWSRQEMAIVSGVRAR